MRRKSNTRMKTTHFGSSPPLGFNPSPFCFPRRNDYPRRRFPSMTTSLPDAQQLAKLVEQSGAVFALTHNYTGYPLVRQAREMILEGQLGQILAVRAAYIQGWLWALKPGETPPRGAWKADPNLAGAAWARPLAVAEREGHEEVAELLKWHGATK